MILAAIIALAAFGLIVLILGIAHPKIEEVKNRSASSGQPANPVVTIRRDAGTPAPRRIPPLAETREPTSHEHEHRRSLRRWRRHASVFEHPRRRLRWSLDRSQTTWAAILAVSSGVLGYLIVRL